MCSSLLKSVNVTEFQPTKAYPSLYLTKVKYIIRRLSMVENENIFTRISPSNLLHVKKEKNQYDSENEVHTQHLHTDP
jgi:hypothetical protein